MNTAPSPAAPADVAGSTPSCSAMQFVLSGITGLALMKLDVLDGLDTVKICTHDQCDGQSCGIPVLAQKISRLQTRLPRNARLEMRHLQSPLLRRAAHRGAQLHPSRRNLHRRPRQTNRHRPQTRADDYQGRVILKKFFAFKIPKILKSNTIS